MKEKLKKIKWEKGFLRIWSVCSIAWVLIILLLSLSNYRQGFIYFLIYGFGWPIGILIFVYATKNLIKFIIDGFK